MSINDNDRDELDEFIAECAQHNPDFPAMVEAALQRRLAMIARGEDPNGATQAVLLAANDELQPGTLSNAESSK